MDNPAHHISSSQGEIRHAAVVKSVKGAANVEKMEIGWSVDRPIEIYVLQGAPYRSFLL